MRVKDGRRARGLTALACADSINLYPTERQLHAVVPPFGNGLDETRLF
jgi:hypothetical protein